MLSNFHKISLKIIHFGWFYYSKFKLNCLIYLRSQNSLKEGLLTV